MDSGAERRSNNPDHRFHRHGKKMGVRVTVVILAIGIAITLFAYTAFASPSSTVHDATSVQQVIFVFRHGDRNPTETYPKDPYLNYDWPGGWGSLTKKGMVQLYNVGRWIRDVYGSLIGVKYKSSLLLAQSSYADRCIMSAQTLLAGLYPPSSDEIFVPGLNWRPVPVHSVPRDLDKTIVVKAPCPRLEEALKEAYANESGRVGTPSADYYRQISAHTGQNIATITEVEFLYNTLEIEKQHGLKLPEWTDKFFNKEMREIAARSLAIFTSNTLQRRLRGGPLLKEILGRMQASKSGTDTRRAYLYSAHDITLVNILRTMGFTSEYFKPDYGATLVFQLHGVTDAAEDAEVKLLYLNDTNTNTPYPMKIPNCGTPCLLGNLSDIWKDVIPDNWDDECLL
ncbi:lysosomal acid phosphatase-like [Hylaeus anthracinus]|uniref:lysosomal acid phosphatase-like n=1 Tax=Hylaeus anthracinus TaxID=313031 RepID=UPI0023B96432|nr:lysosomal acid phosphatase-like [Hylaeus anthracinus]